MTVMAVDQMTDQAIGKQADQPPRHDALAAGALSLSSEKLPSLRRLVGCPLFLAAERLSAQNLRFALNLSDKFQKARQPPKTKKPKNLVKKLFNV
ncbi:MAG: hypothetical protein LBJ64_11925 [Deltaproteobacteria bacterium]|nr:hypothetical protein [Deltaproteobacteria bacterium]